MKRYFVIFFLAIFFIFPSVTKAASLSISPSSGTFSVGSTFDVSLLLDTNGKSVNAIAVALQFPADMLQVVSPSTGQSIIGVWTAAPKFNNLTGKIELQGGIPGGITASSGLVTTLTFRVKSVGQAIVKFLDGSKILLNDGLGTNVLSQTNNNAVFQFKLPPPAGPIVISETNPDQATWYANRTVSFRFVNEAVSVKGYSYVLSDDPTTVPDDISEGIKDSVSYSSLADGTHYFHIKALRNDGIWGGTSHFSIKIDATPPADFNIDISPSSRTSSKQPAFQFSTTDALSGVDHYEVKIISLSSVGSSNNGIFFTEEISPYMSSGLDYGSYDVIIRAYDKAHNFKEITKRLIITTSIFSFITDGGMKLGNLIIPWIWVFFVCLLFLLALIFVLYKTRRWHYVAHEANANNKLPEEIEQKLEELKKYKKRYGAKMIMFIFFFSACIFSQKVFADNLIPPPIITNVSKNVSNQEIFYVGGKTDFSNEKVILFLQNLATGETFNEEVVSDNKGDWFYRHSGFLTPGQYLLWAQGKLGEDTSPPCPQVKMTVNRTAITLGGSRISYETIYLILCIILFICILGLIIFIFYHYYTGLKKHKKLEMNIRETEESIKRGFVVLRRDIQTELAIIKRAKIEGTLLQEEQIREKELLDDLNIIQKQIGKEVWDLKFSE